MPVLSLRGAWSGHCLHDEFLLGGAVGITNGLVMVVKNLMPLTIAYIERITIKKDSCSLIFGHFCFGQQPSGLDIGLICSCGTTLQKVCKTIFLHFSTAFCLYVLAEQLSLGQWQQCNKS